MQCGWMAWDVHPVFDGENHTCNMGLAVLRPAGVDGVP